MSGTGNWLVDLEDSGGAVEGLVQVNSFNREKLAPEQVIVMERAIAYGATAVFFEAPQNDRCPIAQALIFVSDGPAKDPDFGLIHRRIWSWGGVPLIYRKTPGLIQLFRCGHKPDFISTDGKVICKPIKTLKTASAISDDPWWDATRLRNGTLWDDPAACKVMLSDNNAQKLLIDAVKLLIDNLDERGILRSHLRSKLLILSLLIAYLEARGVLTADYFSRFKDGATRFFQVLADGKSLVALLEDLEGRFNGNVFTLDGVDKEDLDSNGQLSRFAKLVEASTLPNGQRTLWELYSFQDLPIEVISHIYQMFVEDADSSVYTPPMLVRLMLEEVLSWKRLDRLQENDEIILDPSCGSGIFLVEAFKRIVLHWRMRNDWKKPTKTVLKGLLKKVHGIDLEPGAVELAAFSLYLALCDALEPEAIRASIKLFPQLIGESLHQSCFFESKENGLVTSPIGVIVGNPPFKSKLTTPGAERSYLSYTKTQGPLPDFQLAYLFLHEAMGMIEAGGALCMLQQYGFLYNQGTCEFRGRFIRDWDLREVLDFISVRGLFKKGDADTKVVVILAEAAKAPSQRRILHATFRRSGRAESAQGFDIDYYDLHWLPRSLVLKCDSVWRTNLFGGGRILGLVDRLKGFRTLEQFARSRNWNIGEGFIAGKKGKSRPADHIIGKQHLPSTALTIEGIDENSIVPEFPPALIQCPYTAARYTPPMLLVHEHENLSHAMWDRDYLTYKDQIVGFAAPVGDLKLVRRAHAWLTTQKPALQAYAAATSTKLFTKKATNLSCADIFAVPYPESEDLDLSVNERILSEDIVDYFRDFIRRGMDSAAMTEAGSPALSRFTEVFTAQINAVYKKNPIKALEPQIWPGVICQPFVFGNGDVDWCDAESLRDKINGLLRERRGRSLQVTRIAKIHEDRFVFLLKPDLLRFWLRSIALRDADETLADLRTQGF